MLVIAHRGDQEATLGNTLEAFESAVELGAPMIELDVQKSKDGELFVLHDQSLFRLTGKDEFLSNLGSEQIMQIELEGGYKIPTLNEVLDSLQAKVKLNIKIKQKGIFDKVFGVLDLYIKNGPWNVDDFVLSSFFHDEIKGAHALRPEFSYAIIFEGYIVDIEKYLEKFPFIYSVNFNFEYADKEFVKRIQDKGFKVYVFTIKSKSEYNIAKEYGVNGVFVNFLRLAN